MRVFISHAVGDGAFARELTEKLRAAKFEPWLAELELTPGQNVALEVGRALDRAEAIVVLLSPEAVKSPWVMSEIEYALTERRFKGRLIPVLARPTREIPWVLRKMSLIDAGSDVHTGSRRVVDALKRVDAAA